MPARPGSNLLLSLVKRVLLLTVSIRPRDVRRQHDAGADAGLLALQADADPALWVRPGPGDPLQGPEMGRDEHLREARRAGFDAEHGGQEIDVRVGAPGVAVGAGGFGVLGPGREAEGQHLPPRRQPLQVMVAEAGAA